MTIPRPPHREVDRHALRVDECRALVAIAAYRAKFGAGPSWRSVGRAAGWNLYSGSLSIESELSARLWALKRARLVTFTREPGSLDVTPGAAGLALRRLRELRELEARS